MRSKNHNVSTIEYRIQYPEPKNIHHKRNAYHKKNIYHIDYETLKKFKYLFKNLDRFISKKQIDQNSSIELIFIDLEKAIKKVISIKNNFSSDIITQLLEIAHYTQDEYKQNLKFTKNPEYISSTENSEASSDSDDADSLSNSKSSETTQGSNLTGFSQNEITSLLQLAHYLENENVFEYCKQLVLMDIDEENYEDILSGASIIWKIVRRIPDEKTLKQIIPARFFPPSYRAEKQRIPKLNLSFMDQIQFKNSTLPEPTNIEQALIFQAISQKKNNTHEPVLITYYQKACDIIKTCPPETVNKLTSNRMIKFSNNNIVHDIEKNLNDNHYLTQMKNMSKAITASYRSFVHTKKIPNDQFAKKIKTLEELTNKIQTTNIKKEAREILKQSRKIVQKIKTLGRFQHIIELLQDETDLKKRSRQIKQAQSLLKSMKKLTKDKEVLEEMKRDLQQSINA